MSDVSMHRKRHMGALAEVEVRFPGFKWTYHEKGGLCGEMDIHMGATRVPVVFWVVFTDGWSANVTVYNRDSIISAKARRSHRLKSMLDSIAEVVVTTPGSISVVVGDPQLEGK